MKKCDDSFTFDPVKKITQIETIIDYDEFNILRINFFSGSEPLYKLGKSDWDVERNAGRRVFFEIAPDEQLIGCELSYDDNCFCGVTWLKIKVPSFAGK